MRWGRLRRMDAVVWITAASLAAWVWLLVGQGFFWRTDLRLPPRTDPSEWPSVCVVVPARDEAAVLPESLPSLLAQDYPGRVEIFLIDDGSTDGTGTLAGELALRHGGLPLTVDSPGEPPAGWTGKLWAVRHGIGLARARDPEFLLLTDADIAHEPDSLRELVAAARTGGFDLVSLMARLRVESVWERLVVPAFVYFFAQLYPFRWIARKGSRTAAAAGGCVLLSAEAADRAAIPDSIRHAVIDGVALARAVKGSGVTSGWASPTASTACAPTRGSATCGAWCPAAPTPSSGTTPCSSPGPWPGSRSSTWRRRSRSSPDSPQAMGSPRCSAGSPGC